MLLMNCSSFKASLAIFKIIDTFKKKLYVILLKNELNDMVLSEKEKVSTLVKSNTRERKKGKVEKKLAQNKKQKY
jgi:hypothetical protein